MNSEFKFHSTTMALHEQHSNFDNLITARRALQTTTTTTTHQHSAHTLTKFDSLTVDNQNNQMTTNNQLQKQLKQQNSRNVDVVAHIASRHHEFRTSSPSLSSSPTAPVASPSSCEDRINNNSSSIERSNYTTTRRVVNTTDTFNTGVSVMSLKKNFSLNLQHQTTVESQSETPASETCLTSPAEAPFGRRYAEISQFKNHPNVEW